ncbi:hypothetical protein HNW77_06105 [Komagataeibacter sp. AV436]|uniref:DUF4175 domain-containing protein n=1 Tax=Komagataeibacter melomenusus TaxID=2766578 RepID=A0ABX2ACD9_9PROT|nr:hypothetical protein [Komagataeibacter melomenusus]MBV1829974.1 hypothetical protein [Komagataeibacter melomenusus]NPC65967.1 hypothetical protein [Komagataeibacter melomenusus]
MLVVAPFLCVASVGLLCWLVFTLAIYALPFAIGVVAFLHAIHAGGGAIGAVVTGFLAGVVTLLAGQMAFALVAVVWFRMMLALIFAIPAALAGYSTTLGLAQTDLSSGIWAHLFAITGAALVGGTAWVRMWAFIPADAQEQDRGRPRSHSHLG